MLILLLALPGAVGAWETAAPEEAVFFADANFQGASLKLSLQPGSRHRLLPTLEDLDKKISSLRLGENVKAIAFTQPHFGGAARVYLYTMAEEMPDDDQIASLIVCPKNEPPQGVLFIQKRLSEVKAPAPRQWHYLTGRGVFFPLPESKQEVEAGFAQVGPEWNDQVRFVYVAPGVETELFVDPEFKGSSLSLPPPVKGTQTVFDLSQYGFYNPKKKPAGVISSLKVKARPGDPK